MVLDELWRQNGEFSRLMPEPKPTPENCQGVDSAAANPEDDSRDGTSGSIRN
jgi:hypothetical protein